MPTVHYTYEKSIYIEDQVDIPQSVIEEGQKRVRAWIEQTVEMGEHDQSCESEEITVMFKVQE